jgi:hypothetical protein
VRAYSPLVPISIRADMSEGWKSRWEIVPISSQKRHHHKDAESAIRWWVDLIQCFTRPSSASFANKFSKQTMQFDQFRT